MHHLNHMPEDCRPENLIALCSKCHLQYDAEFHKMNRQRTIESRNQIKGQISIFEYLGKDTF